MNVKSLLNQIDNEEYLANLLRTINGEYSKRDTYLSLLNESTEKEIFALTEKYITLANSNLKNLFCALCIGAMHDSVSINNDYIYTILFKNVLVRDKFAYYYLCNLISEKQRNTFLEKVNQEIQEKEV